MKRIASRQSRQQLASCADDGPVLHSVESAQELTALATEFLWSRQSSLEKKVLIGEDVPLECPDNLSRLHSTEPELEPHVEWHQQCWALVKGSYSIHVALLLSTLLALVPLTSGAVSRYSETWEARLCALVTLWCLTLIAVDGVPPGPCLFAGSVGLAALGIIDSNEAFSGLSNPCVVAVAFLNLVARSLETSGALERLIVPVLGSPQTQRFAQLRLMLPVCVCSAFMNNTPIVAMMIPVVKGWAAKTGIPEDKLMMPLAYASTMGGAITLIGSGTNLAANQWVIGEGLEPMGFFDLAPIGSILALLGVVYVIMFGSVLLPDEDMSFADDGGSDSLLSGFRYKVSFRVLGPGPFNSAIGKSPKELGLLAVAGASLEPEAHGMSEKTLSEGDELIFNATASAIVNLRRHMGIAPTCFPSIQVLGSKRSHRRHFEAVLSPNSPLVGQPLDLKRFSQAFRAVPFAVHRPGKAQVCVREKSFEGFMPQPQDIFLLEGFLPGPPAGSSDFLLVYEVPDSAPARNFTNMDLMRQRFCLLGLAAVVAATTLGANLALYAALLGTCLLLTKSLSLADVYRFVNGPLLLTIASSFGLGLAIQKSGLAKEIAHIVVQTFMPFGPFGTVFGVYACGAFMGQFLSNVTTALVVLPMTPELSEHTGLPLSMFVQVVIYAANASFASPLATPANLMVSPHGGYTFGDFLRFGGPIQVIFAVASCCLVWAQY